MNSPDGILHALHRFVMDEMVSGPWGKYRPTRAL